ncbi:ribonuclease H [Parazoarcus communis]|jgi:ribonuclease HI|uniref:Ribonuclease H n=1 Tax=Parazoarcus communis TaxID=41977 RepID=A0A2U8H6Z4_9RHOO|nr:ribonuclease HI family protein [Parazoarcus communis]AWI81474.1 ribonuclease H [Parazoarcus communis]PKO57026.1 MAG: ribonuclease H [Betaproteobacteria bacterium HGW-Betaproteobacteria-21]
MVPAPSAGETGDCWLGWFDGAALPNPGKLGLGVVLQSPDGSRVEFSERGEGTGCSNEAELQALCAALSLAHAAGVQRLVLSGDSDFAVRHAAGSAHTAVPRLMALIDKVQALAGLFEAVVWQWVPRHRNGDADRLSRGALGLVHKPAPHPGKALAAKRSRRKR